MFDREEEAILNLIKLTSRKEITWRAETMFELSGGKTGLEMYKADHEGRRLILHAAADSGLAPVSASLQSSGTTPSLSISDENNLVVYTFKSRSPLLWDLWKIVTTGGPSIYDYLEGLADRG